jgi:putative methyltransferase (TIGR04325 family)
MVKQGIRSLLIAAYDLYSCATFHQYGANHRYKGVYGSFAEALKTVPKDQLKGFDHPEVAEFFLSAQDVFNPHDYPLLFWLSRVLESSASSDPHSGAALPKKNPLIFDFGGSLGQTFYAFNRHLHFPEGLRWRVCDLEAAVTRGRELAAEKNVTALEFTTNFADASGADVLLTAGALHCMEEDLSTLLAGLPKRPPHLLINRVPMYKGETYCTIQHNDHSYVANKIMNREAFIRRLEDLGYVLVDRWFINRTIRIPFHPERLVEEFSGFYFRLGAESLRSAERL